MNLSNWYLSHKICFHYVTRPKQFSITENSGTKTLLMH